MFLEILWFPSRYFCYKFTCIWTSWIFSILFRLALHSLLTFLLVIRIRYITRFHFPKIEFYMNSLILLQGKYKIVRPVQSEVESVNSGHTNTNTIRNAERKVVNDVNILLNTLNIWVTAFHLLYMILLTRPTWLPCYIQYTPHPSSSVYLHFLRSITLSIREV